MRGVVEAHVAGRPRRLLRLSPSAKSTCPSPFPSTRPPPPRSRVSSSLLECKCSSSHSEQLGSTKWRRATPRQAGAPALLAERRAADSDASGARHEHRRCSRTALASLSQWNITRYEKPRPKLAASSGRTSKSMHVLRSSPHRFLTKDTCPKSRYRYIPVWTRYSPHNYCATPLSRCTSTQMRP